MLVLLPVLTVLGFLASFVPRGWLIIPLALLIPVMPVLLGAFDDGESVMLIGAWLAVWPAAASLGLAGGRFVQRQPGLDPLWSPDRGW